MNRRGILVAGSAGTLTVFFGGCASLPVIPKRPMPSAEMGQHIGRELRRVAAEALGVDASRIELRLPATTDIARVRATVGSDSVKDFAAPLAAACAIVTGAPLYAGDVRLPGLLHGRELRAPVSPELRSRPDAWNEAAARAARGQAAAGRRHRSPRRPRLAAHARAAGGAHRWRAGAPRAGGHGRSARVPRALAAAGALCARRPPRRPARPRAAQPAPGAPRQASAAAREVGRRARRVDRRAARDRHDRARGTRRRPAGLPAPGPAGAHPPRPGRSGASARLEARMEEQARRRAASARGAGSARCLARRGPALGLSARTLQRRLGERGTGFAEVLGEVRVRLAAAHLAQSGHSVAEIGYLCGFADQPHFTREFSRRAGMPPARYRRTALGAGDRHG